VPVIFAATAVTAWQSGRPASSAVVRLCSPAFFTAAGRGGDRFIAARSAAGTLSGDPPQLPADMVKTLYPPPHLSQVWISTRGLRG